MGEFSLMKLSNEETRISLSSFSFLLCSIALTHISPSFVWRESEETAAWLDNMLG